MKNFSEREKELITHPELGGEKIVAEKVNFNLDDADEIDSIEDDTISFISLDKNGVPIIKKTFYESLGLSQTATSKEIKINFLRIARKYHPDKNPLTLVDIT